MGLFFARLAFLGFLGLVGTITYNALYLQNPRAGVHVSTILQAPEITGEGMAVAGSGQATDVPLVVPVRTSPIPPVGSASAELVRAIQRELAARGYSAGPADGVVRQQTRDAIAAYEKDHKLAVTGTPSDELLRHIVLGASGRPGTTGSVAEEGSGPIRQVQQVLADLGYDPGPVDGVMGAGTKRAIEAFERDRKREPKGEITEELLAEIKRVTGRDIRL